MVSPNHGPHPASKSLGMPYWPGQPSSIFPLDRPDVPGSERWRPGWPRGQIYQVGRPRLHLRKPSSPLLWGQVGLGIWRKSQMGWPGLFGGARECLVSALIPPSDATSYCVLPEATLIKTRIDWVPHLLFDDALFYSTFQKEIHFCALTFSPLFFPLCIASCLSALESFVWPGMWTVQNLFTNFALTSFSNRGFTSLIRLWHFWVTGNT